MARKGQVLLIDDLDRSEADSMIRFGLDGTGYEIDLNAGHAQALRDAPSPYVQAARRRASHSRHYASIGRPSP